MSSLKTRDNQHVNHFELRILSLSYTGVIRTSCYTVFSNQVFQEQQQRFALEVSTHFSSLFDYPLKWTFDYNNIRILFDDFSSFAISLAQKYLSFFLCFQHRSRKNSLANFSSQITLSIVWYVVESNSLSSVILVGCSLNRKILGNSFIDNRFSFKLSLLT